MTISSIGSSSGLTAAQQLHHLASPSGASSDTSADLGKAHHGHGHGHGGGKLESDLQSMIQKLASTTPTDGTLATLEESFDALVSQGSGGTTAATSSGDSLPSFLRALASGLPGAPGTGNVVTAAA